MKSRRGRRSEPFWPSIVMKKWLNVRPKVHDFSEDEIDTETESEDDACSIKDARVHDHARRLQPDQSACATPTQGKSSEAHSGHKRGKSETMRLQYIDKKDIRVTVGTWNVAGKVPGDDLEIDEWLCTKEPADVYILGFQEVVPLNAGNVLGAENRKPIEKWEKIIRKTLNRPNDPLEQKTKYKSFSAPPSPESVTSSVADILAADEINDPMINAFDDIVLTKTSLGGTDINKSMSFRPKRIYGIDGDSNLDWPETSLDTKCQAISSSFKLRRVMSSYERIGFGLRENPLHDAPIGFGLQRPYNSFGNLGKVTKMDKIETLNLMSDFSNRYHEVEEECEDDYLLENSDLNQENAVSGDGLKLRQKYVRIVSKQMVGIYVSIWVRRRLRRHVNHLKVSPVGIGIMGYMGNKGSVSVSMSIYQTRICFVSTHLSSGQKEGDEIRRNANVQEILKRTCFSSLVDFDQPRTIQAHDQVFWFGDLNYRLNGLDTDIRKFVANKQWDELFKDDQLRKELCGGGVFEGWKEGQISFPPTYKFEINSNTYVGENPKEGEKKRSPAWCDRILWLGKGIKQINYQQADLRLSDHRPVSSNFIVKVEVFDKRKLQRALNATTAAIHPEFSFDEDQDFVW